MPTPAASLILAMFGCNSPEEVPPELGAVVQSLFRDFEDTSAMTTALDDLALLLANALLLLLVLLLVAGPLARRPGLLAWTVLALAGVAVALGWKYGAWGGLISGAFGPGTEWGAWAEFIGELHAVVPAALASFGVLILGSLLPDGHSQLLHVRSTD